MTGFSFTRISSQIIGLIGIIGILNKYYAIKEEKPWNVALKEAIHDFGNLKQNAIETKTNKYMYGTSLILISLSMMTIYYLYLHNYNSRLSVIILLLMAGFLLLWLFINLLIYFIQHRNYKY